MKNNFGFWCFNPGFSFNAIQDLGVRSIILTSGTLSPMKSFAYELQTNFQIELENDHVINSSQVCMGVLPRGLEGNNFLFTYQHRDNEKMLLDLGESILEVVKATPDGMLMFFPSYALMEKISKLWERKGIVEEIEKYKQFYVEPKTSSRFKNVRRNFENDVNTGTGAILLGVCRGKVSEGLDFSDRAAR